MCKCSSEIAGKSSVGKARGKKTDPEHVVRKAVLLKKEEYDIVPQDGDSLVVIALGYRDCR